MESQDRMRVKGFGEEEAKAEGAHRMLASPVSSIPRKRVSHVLTSAEKWRGHQDMHR